MKKDYKPTRTPEQIRGTKIGAFRRRVNSNLKESGLTWAAATRAYFKDRPNNYEARGLGKKDLLEILDSAVFLYKEDLRQESKRAK